MNDGTHKCRFVRWQPYKDGVYRAYCRECDCWFWEARSIWYDGIIDLQYQNLSGGPWLTVKDTEANG